MSIRSGRTVTSLFGLVALILVAASPLVAGDEEFRETYTTRAVAMGTSNPPVIPPGSRVTLQINVTRWSTNEERTKLLTALQKNGAEGFVETLGKQKETGWVRATGPTRTRSRRTFPSQRFRYAREIKREDGSRRIVLALERPITMWESVNQPRWRDHDVTLVVLDVDEVGDGEGQLAMGARLAINDENALVIENFGSEPIRLTNVRRSD